MISNIRYLALISILSLMALFPACKCSMTTAKLSDLATYKDKTYAEKTSNYEPRDTFVLQTGTEYNISEGEVEWRLFATNVAGQQPNTPVPQGDKTDKVDGNKKLSYALSPPNNGWPAGTYTVEVTLKLDGEIKDKKSVEFTVIAPPEEPAEETDDDSELPDGVGDGQL